MKVKFTGKEPQAKNIESFYFEPAKKPHYTAGQFIELYLPHENKDDRGIKRWFTLSSSPTEDLLAITTNFTEPGGSTFKNILKNLNEGDELDMASPMGDFVLPKDSSIPLVFVAGGIGCTPFRSIIKFLTDDNEKRDITLIYSAKTASKVAFKELFNDYLGKNFKEIIGEQLTAESVKKLGNISDKHYVYVSGPEPMVEVLEKDLKKSGVNKKHLYTDFFPNYPA